MYKAGWSPLFSSMHIKSRGAFRVYAFVRGNQTSQLTVVSKAERKEEQDT